MKASVAAMAGNICLVTLFSCTTGSVQYKNIAKEEKFPLADGRTDSIGIRINIDFPEKCGDALKKNMTATIITSAFGEPYADKIEPYAEMEPESVAEAWKDNLIETYRKDNFDFLEIIGEDNVPAGLNWEAFRNGKETSRTKTFNRYDIAAYAYGIIDIFIPAEEIRPYTNPGLKLF